MGVWTPGPGATAGDDTFAGDATNEAAAGLGGNDTLNGAAGDDTLEGGAGDDTIDGGEGNDTASYATAPLTSAFGVSVSLGVAGPQATGAAGVDTLTGIENLIGSAFRDTLTGDALANVLSGGADNDTLIGNDGADQLVGGAGNDSLRGGEGDDVIDAGPTANTLGDDNLFGGGGDDTLNGGEGNDFLSGNRNDDILIGGAGLDMASYFDATAAVTVSLALQGLAQDTIGAGVDTLSGIEELEGSEHADVLTGSSGDDVLAGLADVDTLDGGAGLDLVDYRESDAPVAVDIATQTAIGGHAGDLLSGFEGAIGSAFNDTLVGDAGVNVLRGHDGDDLINGGAGADRLEGGDGDDRFALGATVDGVDQIFGGVQSADSGFDTLDYSAAGAGVTVQLLGWSTTTGGALLATFSGIEAVIGTAFSDALIGNVANNRLEGGAGADWLVGGGGDDTFVQGVEGGGEDRLFGGTNGADAGFDTIDYSGASAGVTVQLSGYSTSGGVTLATFTGIEAAIGSAFDDAIIGDAANNRITGGAGADWLVGQGGDDWFVQGPEGGSIDRLFGDAGVDTIDYSEAGAAVTVQLSGYATRAGATVATFTGMEGAVGTNLADALIGNASDNRLAGGAGADWLVGDSGNDTFVQTVDTTSIDQIFGGTAGADADLSDTIDYSGGSQGVVVQLSGYATTNDGGNITLATFTGIENAVGTAFADALIGSAANNRITGGGGADWLIGGAGADTFVYLAVENTLDSIRDFAQGADRIDLSGIDANPTTGADNSFTFATTRHAGVVGEAVVANFGGFSLVSLYLDADNVADMTVQVVHPNAVVMNAGDFVL